MNVRSTQQYLDKLAFVAARQRVFDLEGYDLPPEDWTSKQKSALTKEYNRAVLANSTDELAAKKKYGEMLRILRPFVDGFETRDGYDLRKIDKLSPARKAKLTRYYKKAVMLASKQFELYYPRDKKTRKIVERQANQQGFPQFTGVFYPAPAGSKLTFDSRAKTLRALGLRWATVKYLFEEYDVDLEALADNPESTVKEFLDTLPHKKYSINAGEHSVGQGVPRLFTRGAASRKVAELVLKYGSDFADPNDPNSSFHGNWLNGVQGWDFASREDEQEYVNRTRAESEERRRYKRALRKRTKRNASGAIKKRGGIRRNPTK